MATFNSQQYAVGQAFPVQKIDPFDYYGRMRKARATFIVGTDGGGAAIPSGSVINLFYLPPRAKVLGGKMIFGSLGTSATASIGLVNGLGTLENGTTAAAGAGTEFLSAGAVATAGQLPIANTQALNYGYLIANPPAVAASNPNTAVVGAFGDLVTLTTGGATYTAAIYFSVELEFIVD